MKALKRILSVILMLNLLIGIPMSVSAINTGATESFMLTQAVVVSREQGTQWGNYNNWGANVVSNTGKIMLLYANKPIRSESPTLCVRVEAADGTVKEQYKNTASTTYLWFQGPFGFQNTGKAENPFAVVSGNMPTFQALVDSTKAGGANEGCKVYLYLIDQDTTMDGRVRGLHNMNDGNDRLVSNTTMDSREAFRIEITDSYLTADRAVLRDENSYEVHFNQPVTTNKSYFAAIRLVDKNNNLMQRDATTIDGTLGNGSYYQWAGSLTFNGTDKGVFTCATPWSTMASMLDKVRLTNPGGEYSLKLCIEENSAAVPLENARGEYVHNGFVDTVWGVSSRYALKADSTKNGWPDSALVTVDAQPTLLAATRISNTQMRLNFSQDIVLSKTDIHMDDATISDLTAENGKTWLVTANGLNEVSTVTVGQTSCNLEGWNGIDLSGSSDITNNGKYNFMNADTGREISVGGIDEFTLVSSGTNTWYIKNGNRYLDLTGTRIGQSDYPIDYKIVKVANERYQIIIDSAVILDVDAGTTAVATPGMAYRDNQTIQTGWYLTAAGNPRPIKVMPFGDSITYGINSETLAATGYEIGWRDTASEALGNYFDRVVFVGPRVTKPSSLTDTQLFRHAGFPGWVINRLDSYNAPTGYNGIDTVAQKIVDKYKPDVTLLMIGTNDIGFMTNYGKKSVTSTQMLDLFVRYEKLVESIAPKSHENGSIILSKLTPRKDNANINQVVDYFNARMDDFVAQRQAQGYAVYLNDNNTGFPQDGLFTGDNVHMSESGDAFIADRYNQTVQSVYDADGQRKDRPALSNDITIVSVDAVGPNRLKITFSEPVYYDLFTPQAAKGSAYVGIRMLTQNGELANSGGYLQTGVTMASSPMSPDPSDPSVWYWSWNGRSISDYEALLAQNAGWKMGFYIEESGSSTTARTGGYIESFTSLDGTKKLVQNNKMWGVDGTYAPINTVSIEKITVVGVNTLHVFFSEPVKQLNAPGWAALRVVDADGELVGTDGSSVVDRFHTPIMQWGGSFAPIGDGRVWEYNFLGCDYGKTFAQMYDYYQTNWAPKGCQLTFAIESAASHCDTDGLVNDFASVASGRKLRMNNTANWGVEGLYTRITSDSFDFSTQPLTLLSARLVNDNQVLASFSDAVHPGTLGSYFIGLRRMNGTAVAEQWNAGSWTYYNTEKSMILLTINGFDGNPENVVFAIEEGADASQGVFVGNNALIHNVHGVDSGVVTGTQLTGVSGAKDSVTCSVEKSGQITVLGVDVVDEHTVKVTYSDVLDHSKYPTNTNAYVSLRVLDDALTMTELPNRAGSASYSPWQYYNRDIRQDANDPKIWYYTFDENLYDLEASFGDGSIYEDYALYFSIEEKTLSGQGKGILGAVDNYTDVTGKKCLVANHALWNVEGFYRELTFADPEQTKGVTIEEVKIVSDDVMEITFSQAVTVGDTSVAVRLMNAQGQFLWLDADGELRAWPTSWTTPMQVMGRFTAMDNSGKNWRFVANAAHGANLLNLTQMMEDYRNHAEYSLAFALEENNGPSYDGLISGIVSTENGRCLLANNTANFNKDGTYFPIDDSAFTYSTDALTVTKVEQVSTSLLRVTFSRPVMMHEYTGLGMSPFVGIRMVETDPTRGETVVWAGPDGVANHQVNGYYRQMQWKAVGWKFDDDTQTSLVIDMGNVDIYSVVNKMNMQDFLKDDDYRVVFAIEESPAAGEEQYVKGNGVIHNVRSKVDGKQLTATSCFSGRPDGCYAPITLLAPDAPVTYESQIVGENEIKITFSESMDITEYFADIRLVDPVSRAIFGNEKDGFAQWSGTLTAQNESRTEYLFIMRGSSQFTAYSLADIVERKNGASEFDKSLVTVLNIEEKNGTNTTVGFIDSFGPLSGKPLPANPYVSHSWYNDGIQFEIKKDELIRNDYLTVVSAVAVTNQIVEVTFSAPVEYTGSAWTAVRLYDKDGNLVWKHKDGTYGGWAKDAAPIQWASLNWEYANEEQTKIRFRVGGRAQEWGNLDEIFAQDWNEIVEGGFIGFCIEENDNIQTRHNIRVGNIALKSDSRICLLADNFKYQMHGDNTFCVLTKAYVNNPVSVKVSAVNDMQVRISFNRPVNIPSNPFMALRVIRDGELVWTGTETYGAYSGVPLQIYGSWKWENEKHTSILWTINGNGIYGVRNLYDFVNWANGLQAFKKDCQIVFCIEELSKDEFVAYANNGLVDNLIAIDGGTVAEANYFSFVDGLYLPIDNSDLLVDEEPLTLKSLTAVDEHNVEIVFSRPVAIEEGEFAPTMIIRYLSESGEADVLTDGKKANFRGTWKYKDDSKTTIIWTLDSSRLKGATLTDIFMYNGQYKWNKGSRVAFIIEDPEGAPISMHADRFYSIYSLDGVHHLATNRINERALIQMDIELGYELPVTDMQEDTVNINYITDYRMIYLIAAAIAVVFAVIAVILVITKKRTGKER